MTGREGPVNPDNFKTVRSHLPAGRVLDVGSGNFHPHADVTVDIEPETEPDVVADLSAGLPFEDGAFEAVTALHILEHLPDDVGLWDELCRVAGERVVAIVPLGLRDDPDHEHEYDRQDAVERFEPDECDLSSMGAYYDLVLVRHV